MPKLTKKELKLYITEESIEMYGNPECPHTWKLDKAVQGKFIRHICKWCGRIHILEEVY